MQNIRASESSCSAPHLLNFVLGRYLHGLLRLAGGLVAVPPDGRYTDEEGPDSSEEEEERAVGALSKEMGEAVAAAVIEFVYKPP